MKCLEVSNVMSTCPGTGSPNTAVTLTWYSGLSDPDPITGSPESWERRATNGCGGSIHPKSVRLKVFRSTQSRGRHDRLLTGYVFVYDPEIESNRSTRSLTR